MSIMTHRSRKYQKSETKELAGQKVITDKDAAEDYVYVNTAGDAKHYFPEKLDEDSAVVMVKKNHTISFAPVRKEETVQESLESSENTGSVQESPKVVKIPVLFRNLPKVMRIQILKRKF